MSSALGAANTSYAAHHTAGGLQANNPAQRLSTSFLRSGVVISSASSTASVALRGAGYGAALRAVAPSSPIAHGNRVSYSHPGISEWYTNGPLGVEQGFTIPRPLPSPGHGPLTLSLPMRGNLSASLVRGGRKLRFSRAGALVVTYSGLVATDARRHALPAWISLHHNAVLLQVDTRGARYPVRIDPLFQNGSKLKGTGAAGNPNFGTSVAISTDDTTAVVGGSYDNNNSGAAWVFTRSGAVWTQQGAKLRGSCAGTCTGPNGTGEVGAGLFGTSVALSSDGNTALIGAPGDNSSDGAAWVFTRSGSSWSQQGSKLRGDCVTTCVGPDGTGESGKGAFGASVALSSDGNTAVIGAPANSTNTGAVWVFTRTASVWSQQGTKLTGGSNNFGVSVALSSDGNTALIGSTRQQCCGDAGSAYVFTRTASVWTQQGSALVANCTSSCSGPNGTGEVGPGAFGTSVALSSDGNTALIGAYNDDFGVGAVWVFTRTASVWSQQGNKLLGTGAVGNAGLGTSVALSSDGNTALAGGPLDNHGRGAVWEFTRSGSSWSQVGGKLTPRDESGAGSFGASVSLSGDAARAIIGGNGDGGTGAAWVFGPPPPTAHITSPPSGRKFNLGQTVTTTFFCTAGSAPIQSCKDSHGASPPHGKLTTSTVGVHTYTVTATSTDGAKGTATITYIVVGRPTITIKSPVNGKGYAKGQKVKASYQCHEAANGPGIKSCKGTVKNGSNINTSTTGAHAFKVTATSKDGQKATKTVHYTVHKKKKKKHHK